MSAVVQPPSPDASEQHAALRPILDIVGNALQIPGGGFDAGAMVILDDITSLEWIGFSSLDLLRFSRALCALCRRVPILQYVIIEIQELTALTIRPMPLLYVDTT